jgi:uncharacterized protein YdiU (UPF0061 family)
MRWNLEKLSEALFPIVSREDSKKILSRFDEVYEAERREIMNKKFGFLRTMEGQVAPLSPSVTIPQATMS